MNSLFLFCLNGCIVVERDLPCFVTKILCKSTLYGISEGYSLKKQININFKNVVIFNFDIMVLTVELEFLEMGISKTRQNIS